MQRRAGQAHVHQIDRFLQASNPEFGRRPGSLAVRCPACPEVGVNVSVEEIKNASEAERYVVAI